VSQVVGASATWLTAIAARLTNSSAGSETRYATASLVTTQAPAGSGVIRSWRVQPAARSWAIGTAVESDAPIIP
jgi:hypothetical protein